MRWMTLAHLHLDRVASAWLIVRFVDEDAEFEFLEWDAKRPTGEDRVLFGMPGISLSSHDDRGTCFGKVLRAQALDDPALALLERVVAAGVAHALDHEPVDLDDDMHAVGVALDLVGAGFGVTSDDPQHLERALPLYDALYALCRARTLPEELRARMPRLPGERAAFLRETFAANRSSMIVPGR